MSFHNDLLKILSNLFSNKSWLMAVLLFTFSINYKFIFYFFRLSKYEYMTQCAYSNLV